MSDQPIKIHNRAHVTLTGSITVDGESYPLTLEQSLSGAVSLTYKAGGKTFRMAFGTDMLGRAYHVDLAPMFHGAANTIRAAIDESE